jgi:hypothetical protein
MDRSDLGFAIGACAIGAGLGWWIHPAAGVIWGGLVICAAAFLKAGQPRPRGG